MYSIFEISKKWAKQNNRSVWAETETTSTNAIAKEKALEFEVYLADQQTAGRGRGDNSWHNPLKGSALLSSWTFHLSQPPQPIATPLFGLALFKAFKDAWPAFPFSLKAPNDIYLNDKKTAGLLIEVVSVANSHLLVVGLGVNVFSHPKEIEYATHLAEFGEITQSSWFQFLDKVQREFSEMTLISTNNKMSDKHCEEIKNALNLFPLLKAQVEKVDPLGHIITPEKRSLWH